MQLMPRPRKCEMGLIPDYEIRLAQELCVAMGECAATYYIVLLLEERQKLEAEVQRLQEDGEGGDTDDQSN